MLMIEPLPPRAIQRALRAQHGDQAPVTPEEVASLALYVDSPEGAATTGALLDISGGTSLSTHKALTAYGIEQAYSDGNG